RRGARDGEGRGEYTSKRDGGYLLICTTSFVTQGRHIPSSSLLLSGPVTVWTYDVRQHIPASDLYTNTANARAREAASIPTQLRKQRRMRSGRDPARGC